MALDYSLLGEVARLTGGEKIARPVPVRDRWGRWHRDPRGELDWFYQLSPTERAYVSRFYMAPGASGVPVDVIASAAFMDVDRWADAFVSAVRAARDAKFANMDPLDDEYGTQWTDDDDEWLGPEEVAALLVVKRNTLAQWKHRGHLPEPITRLSGMPIWRRGDVMAFAVDTGREVTATPE